MRDNQSRRRATDGSTEVIILLTATALVAGYSAMRYRGLWGDSDTAAFASAIRAMIADARLIPQQHVYSNGYGFPTLATFLLHITGLSVAQMQITGGALLAVWVVIPVWLAYRELTSSTRGATLATVIILVQAEFLFPILRGSHEKFTRGLMFLCLYLLVRSILARQQTRLFSALLLAFYLALYALITFNNLMATSFIVALGLALLLSLGVRKVAEARSDSSSATQRRLFYAVGISLLLAFIFTFFAYPPARSGLRVVESIWDRLALLVLDVEETATTVNPYLIVSAAWTSLPVYLMISIANWLLLALSFVLWSTQTLSWWRNQAWPREARPLLLWSLYGAFGFLGAISIAIDFSGALASNLQHRVFPSFAMIAAPLVADWFVRQRAWRPGAHSLANGTLAIGIALLGILAVAKATNEPLLSNTWQYYTIPEKRALLWGERHLDQEMLWVGINERIPAAMDICCPNEFEKLTLSGGRPRPAVRDLLISDTIRVRAARVGFNLPVAGDSLLTYTNGEADLFHQRPRTPFQK